MSFLTSTGASGQTETYKIVYKDGKYVVTDTHAKLEQEVETWLLRGIDSALTTIESAKNLAELKVLLQDITKLVLIIRDDTFGIRKDD